MKKQFLTFVRSALVAAIIATVPAQSFSMEQQPAQRQSMWQRAKQRATDLATGSVNFISRHKGKIMILATSYAILHYLIYLYTSNLNSCWNERATDETLYDQHCMDDSVQNWSTEKCSYLKGRMSELREFCLHYVEMKISKIMNHTWEHPVNVENFEQYKEDLRVKQFQDLMTRLQEYYAELDKALKPKAVMGIAEITSLLNSTASY